MGYFVFGSGVVFGVRSDVSVATPVQLATLQEGSVEFSGSNKDLFGGYQYPVATARGTSKISGKSKFADINPEGYKLFFGDVDQTTGALVLELNEIHSIPATTPFTVNADYKTTFAEDLGLIFADTGQPLTKVASAPAAGEYSVAAGVYTFAEADASKEIASSYTRTATTGVTMVVSNQVLGVAPIFKLYLRVVYSTNQLLLKLHACTSSKLSFATKLEDWLIPEFDFAGQADAAGRVVTIGRL